MSGIHNLVVIYALKQFLRDKKKGVVGVGIMHTTCIFKLLIRGVHLSSGFVQICLSVSRWVKSHEWKRLHYCLECWWRVGCCSCSQGRLDWGESCKYLWLSHLCNFAQQLFFYLSHKNCHLNGNRLCGCGFLLFPHFSTRSSYYPCKMMNINHMFLPSAHRSYHQLTTVVTYGNWHRKAWAGVASFGPDNWKWV